MKNAQDQNEQKYLSFCLGEETYGVEVLRVREIMGIQEISPLPKTAEYVRGVINLRGMIVPVIELRRKFAMESIETTEQTCIIVVEVAGSGEGQVEQVGLIVDRVSEVLDIARDQIEHPPQLGGLSTGLIQGIGKVGKEVVLLLDIDRAVASEEVVSLQAVRVEAGEAIAEPASTSAEAA